MKTKTLSDKRWGYYFNTLSKVYDMNKSLDLNKQEQISSIQFSNW